MTGAMFLAAANGDQTLLMWGLGLFGLALTLTIIELFIPSAGIIGALSGVAAIAGVVCFFLYSPGTWGPLSLLTMLVLAPAVVAFGLKIWPHTPIGRRLILGDNPEHTDVTQAHDQTRTAQRERDRALLGKQGEALTDLYPVGAARIDGRTMEVLAQGGLIEAGQRVRIVAVVDNQIKVRRI